MSKFEEIFEVTSEETISEEEKEIDPALLKSARYGLQRALILAQLPPAMRIHAPRSLRREWLQELRRSRK